MEKKDFQASHKDRIKAVISIPDESSEVTNRIVGKQEENSKVLAECSDVMNCMPIFLYKSHFSCIQIKLVSFDCNCDPHNYAAINANAVF